MTNTQDALFDLPEDEQPEHACNITNNYTLYMEANNIKPGDHVLITLAYEATPENAEALRGTLKAAFPDTEFDILCGASAFKVIPADERRDV